jgi:hypothetical protein
VKIVKRMASLIIMCSSAASFSAEDPGNVVPPLVTIGFLRLLQYMTTAPSESEKGPRCCHHLTKEECAAFHARAEAEKQQKGE